MLFPVTILCAKSLLLIQVQLKGSFFVCKFQITKIITFIKVVIKYNNSSQEILRVIEIYKSTVRGTYHLYNKTQYNQYAALMHMCMNYLKLYALLLY